MLSCNGDEEVEPMQPANFDLEIKEGAWMMQSVNDSDGNIILDGNGHPELLFFFLENNVLKGKLIGEYQIDSGFIHLKAEIDTVKPIFFSEIDILGNFPQRYYDFEKIVKNGITGKIKFYENGWDSQISIHMTDGRVIWFMRY
jgi:hypothetical protein